MRGFGGDYAMHESSCVLTVMVGLVAEVSGSPCSHGSPSSCMCVRITLRFLPSAQRHNPVVTCAADGFCRTDFSKRYAA